MLAQLLGDYRRIGPGRWIVFASLLLESWLTTYLGAASLGRYGL